MRNLDLTKTVSLLANVGVVVGILPAPLVPTKPTSAVSHRPATCNGNDLGLSA